MPLRTSAVPLSPQDEQRGADAARLYEMIAGQWVSSVVRTIAVLGVMDAIADRPHAVEDVARATGTDPVGMDRLLRVA